MDIFLVRHRTGGPDSRTRLAAAGGTTRTSVKNCPISGHEAVGTAVGQGIASRKILGRLHWVKTKRWDRNPTRERGTAFARSFVPRSRVGL